ncbi:MAG: TraR/DksA family transcriptional regulator [Planctomycetia bacterium]|nr:TraR/DksA family transcriptional regulator [Planctomycetia bacterium]
MNQSKLTAQELREFRKQLESLVARLNGGVAELRDATRGPKREGDLPPEPADRQGDPSSHTAEEELALVLMGTEETVLAEAKAALARLERGTFGRCEVCGQPIARARLDAIPYTPLCIDCARKATR